MMTHSRVATMKKIILVIFIVYLHCISFAVAKDYNVSCSNNSFIIFRHNFFVEFYLVIDVELAQQIIALLNHPIYFFYDKFR